jgi:hypothetical protein
VLSVFCQLALFVVGDLEIVDSFAKPFRGGGIILGAPTAPEFPKGGLQGISEVRALSPGGGKMICGGRGRSLLGIVNALCAFPTEGAMPDH